MIRLVLFFALPLFMLASSAISQTMIKVLRFDKSTGVIDRGKDAGIKVGDIFEVNRYSGEFVYWVGRVEVYIVRPKISGIKLIAKADNAAIQPGDVLALQHDDSDPLQDKLGGATNTAEAPPRTIPITNKKPADKTPPRRSEKPLWVNFSSGGLYAFPGSSRSMGMNVSLEITNSSNRVLAEVDLSRAFASGFAVQAGLTLPLSQKISVDLNYAYLPLRVRNTTEAQLLRYGLKATASLAQISGGVNYRLATNWQAGLGAGLYLPQVKIEGNRAAAALSERQWGWLAAFSHLLPLGQNVGLKSTLAYNVFLDNGPAIHFFVLQTGLSFAFGR